MPTRQPRYSAEETARRGDAIYERDIRPHLEETHRGKVVAIDVDSGGRRNLVRTHWPSGAAPP